MPEEVTISEDGQYIVVTSFGEVADEDFRKTLGEILEIRNARGLTKVFVDAREVSSYPSIITILGFGADAAPLLSEAGVRLAILAPPEATEQPLFFENATTNRGVSTKVFDARDAALSWLNEEPSLNARARV